MFYKLLELAKLSCHSSLCQSQSYFHGGSIQVKVIHIFALLKACCLSFNGVIMVEFTIKTWLLPPLNLAEAQNVQNGQIQLWRARRVHFEAVTFVSRATRQKASRAALQLEAACRCREMLCQLHQSLLFS